ncbi:MAG: InlB B-repeat-containing protein [Clostridiales bacterium]|nr:InlB B-repeat-containing protein [Clostridiales bacterium]
MSLAKWTLGDDSNATQVEQGKASNFYIEYPRYVSSSGENEITIPSLSADKYYMQVPQRGNTGTADFYEFKSHSSSEVKLESVYLYQGDVLSMFYGKTYQSILGQKGGLDKTNNDGPTTGYLELNDGKFTVKAEGFYDFFYVHGEQKFYVDYYGKPSEDNNDSNEGNTIDTSGYTELFSIKFSGDTQTKRLFFKIGTGASSPYNSLDNFAVHIRDRNWRAYYYNFNVYPGNNSNPSDGNMRYVRSSKYPDNALEGQTLEVGTKADTVIVFGFDQSHLNNNSTTAAGVNGASQAFDLADYAKGEINLITLHTAKGGTPKLKTSGFGSVSSPADDLTAIAPDYEGTTDFHNGGTVDEQLNTKKTVRKVTSGAQGEGNKYVYKNYICVSRKNSSATDDDNSIAYLEFEVSDCTINPYDVKITSLTLKRRATDASGNIKDRFVDPAPRIYNYDANLDTRLGQDASDKDYSNPNKQFDDEEDQLAARKPLFACGIEHTSYESAGQMKPHLDDGVYVVLYFGDNDQQYFALDIEIELELTVPVPDGVSFDFTLQAQLANENSWERYADGFGEPWGYYMGGLINGVDVWDPSRTTKLERATDRYVTNYVENLETATLRDVIGASSIESATDEQLAAFNALPDEDFNYKIIKFYKEGGAVEGYARYPKGKIDVSLTVNLTEGSLIKMYMLDHDGDRKGGNTVWIIPSEIIYDEETKKLFRDETTYTVYDESLNTIIPKTGTYVFRLVGYFRTRTEAVENSKGEILSGNLLCLEDGKRYNNLSDIPAGKTGVGLPNFNFWVDTLYITCSSAGEGNSECTITLDANGGTFKAADLKEGDTETIITRTVTFGSDLKGLPQPTRADKKKLLGWYYEDADGNTVDVDFGSPVTSNMTLKAKWEANYLVTFDANGGNLPSGVENPVQTDEYGNLTKEQWNAYKPTNAGLKFMGWYTAQTGGTKLGTDTTFTKDRTVYAHWEAADQYTVKFNLNGLPIDEIEDSLVYDGEKVSQPVITMPANYTFVNWTDSTGTAYDFNKTVTGNIELFANYYAENGVYLNGVRVKTLTLNTGSTNGTEYMALDVPVTADNSVLTFWYDRTERSSTVKTGNTPYYQEWHDNGVITLGRGVYNFYYKFGSTNSQDGLWIALDKYIITFDLNYVGSAAATTVYTGSLTNGSATVAAADRPADPTRDDYSFDGWYEAENGGTKVNLSTKSFSANTTLYAHWVQTHTVTFDANGGSWGDETNPHTQAIRHGEKAEWIAGPDNAPYGKMFDCWSTSNSTSGGAAFNFDTLIETDIVLYAQWKDRPAGTITITFDANGGDCNTTSTEIAVGGSLTALPTPTRDYHTFNGWFTEGGEEVTTSTTFSTDTTIYAHWTAQTITFKFVSPGWSGINSVKITAIGDSGDYTQVTMSGTDPNYTSTYTLNATNGNIIGVKIQFNQTGSAWTAHWEGYADYQAGETYTITYVGWGTNPDWSGVAPFTATVKDSSGATITTGSGGGGSDIDASKYITVEFSDGKIYLDVSSCSSTPNQLYMWGGNLSISWPGDYVTVGGTKTYSNVSMSSVTGLILCNNGNNLTGDLKPGNGFAALEDGAVYKVGNQVFEKQ